jgi:AraC family transcriptional regulator, regulatory protein of adaptative response / DNA-3-methyladenine glycosylase II
MSTRRLSYRAPLAEEPLMRFLGDRAIPGVETFDGLTFRRAIRAPDDRALVIELTPEPAEHQVQLDVRDAEATDVDPVERSARRLLDLDADPAVVDAALAADPRLRPLIRATPGIRVPGAIDGFELAVRAVLGQQVSVRAARTFAGRLATAIGTAIDGSVEGVTHLFPSAEQLADTNLDGLGLTSARTATLRRLAKLVADGSLDLSDSADRGSTLDTLLGIKGIGPWTAAYVAMRVLRDPDAFPSGDLGVRLGFEALGLSSKLADIVEHAERWRPWRAYAVMHLWNSGP